MVTAASQEAAVSFWYSLGAVKISFVIPAYNEEAHIGACVESILKEIQANNLVLGTDAEVVVVNNASTDRTAAIAASYDGVTVLNEPIKGLVMARRAGFVVTTGELVANIDSDTRMPQGWLRRVLHEFDTNKRLVALSGPFIYYDLSVFERALVKVFYAFGYVAHWLGGAMLQGGNFVIDRAAWERAGGFDTTIAFYGEDTDVARRLAKQGTVKWSWGLPMETSGRRLRGEGLVSTGFTYALNFVWTTLTGRPYTRAYQDIRVVK